MKIRIAGEGETLITIAQQIRYPINQLVLLNPHITTPRISLAGKVVYLPSQTDAPVKMIPDIPGTCPPLMLPHYLNQWIPLVSPEQMKRNVYDVLIVGSGAGGGAALWRMCEQWKNSGKRIGMIEAGDLLLPTNAKNVSTLDEERFDQFIWNPLILVPKGYPQFSGARELNALGGRTLVWDVNCPRMHPSVFKDWPVTAKEMALYYNIAERVMNVTKEYSRNSPITQILLDRLWYSGFPEATETPRAMDLKPVKDGKVNSDVYFSSILFLAQALRQRNFDLAINSRAVRLLAEKRAIGVEIQNGSETHVLTAKNVILSASTFETPRLLLYSGIHGEAVGRYLIDHAGLITDVTVDRQQFPEVYGPLSILIPPTNERPYQFLISNPYSKPSEEAIAVTIRGYGSVEPRFDNGVSLDPSRKDELGVPELQVQYAYTPEDEATIRGVTAAMYQVTYALRITSFLKNICLRPPGNTHHESGTCRMGVDPATSAANRYGQIHEIPGLYVADNSVLPFLGVANPTLTTVALAIRTADYIAERMR